VKAGEAVWSNDLLQLAGQRRDPSEANRKVAASEFAINRSACALLHLYSGGVPA
jgi:hypothetical protein